MEALRARPSKPGLFLTAQKRACVCLSSQLGRGGGALPTCRPPEGAQGRAWPPAAPLPPPRCQPGLPQWPGHRRVQAIWEGFAVSGHTIRKGEEKARSSISSMTLDCRGVHTPGMGEMLKRARLSVSCRDGPQTVHIY